MIWAVNDMQDQWTHSAARSAEPPGSAGTQLDAEEASRDCPTPWRRRCASASPWGSRLHLVTTATGATAGGKTEGRLLKNRNSQDSQEQRQPSEGFMTSFTSSLSSLHLSPTSLFIYLPLSLCLSGCQPPDAWQSSSTAAGLVTFQTRASGPNTNASLCNGKGIFLCDVQPTLLDGSQDSQVFIRRCC